MFLLGLVVTFVTEETGKPGQARFCLSVAYNDNNTVNGVQCAVLFAAVVTSLGVPSVLHPSNSTTYLESGLHSLPTDKHYIFKMLMGKGWSKTNGKKMAKACGQNPIDYKVDVIAEGKNHKSAKAKAIMATKQPAKKKCI